MWMFPGLPSPASRKAFDGRADCQPETEPPSPAFSPPWLAALTAATMPTITTITAKNVHATALFGALRGAGVEVDE